MLNIFISFDLLKNNKEILLKEVSKITKEKKILENGIIYKEIIFNVINEGNSDINAFLSLNNITFFKIHNIFDFNHYHYTERKILFFKEFFLNKCDIAIYDDDENFLENIIKNHNNDYNLYLFHFFPEKIVSYLSEETLSTNQRNKMKKSSFGIPELRKYPLNDKEHVIKAIQFFKYCPKKYKKLLASKIRRKAKLYNIKSTV